MEILLTGLGWLRQLGAPGLFVLGIIDGSFIPLPGGLDLVTAFLAAKNRSIWFYYGLVSTSGSVLGGYVTYRIAQKSGKGTLGLRFSKEKLERLDKVFLRWGFGTVFMSALLPPPFPTVPFLAGAGALNYPARKFIAALGIARLLRFAAVSYLASIYGERVLQSIANAHLDLPVILALVALVVGASALTYYISRRSRRTV